MRPEIPTMAVLLDAFRFHRLRREGSARVLFLLCLLANLGPVLLPLGKGFKGFLEATVASASTSSPRRSSAAACAAPSCAARSATAASRCARAATGSSAVTAARTSVCRSAR